MISLAKANAQMVVIAIQSDRSHVLEGLLIQEIKNLLSWFNNVSCSFTLRSCNSLAHHLARLVFSKHCYEKQYIKNEEFNEEIEIFF